MQSVPVPDGVPENRNIGRVFLKLLVFFVPTLVSIVAGISPNDLKDNS
jgi:hypothetical protein